MHDVVLMAVHEGRSDFLHDHGRFGFGQMALVQNIVKKLTSLTEFSHYVESLGFLVKFENFNDIWMIDCSQNLDFIYKFLLLFL